MNLNKPTSKGVSVLFEDEPAPGDAGDGEDSGGETAKPETDDQAAQATEDQGGDEKAADGKGEPETIDYGGFIGKVRLDDEGNPQFTKEQAAHALSELGMRRGQTEAQTAQIKTLMDRPAAAPAAAPAAEKPPPPFDMRAAGKKIAQAVDSEDGDALSDALGEVIDHRLADVLEKALKPVGDRLTNLSTQMEQVAADAAPDATAVTVQSLTEYGFENVTPEAAKAALHAADLDFVQWKTQNQEATQAQRLGAADRFIVSNYQKNQRAETHDQKPPEGKRSPLQRGGAPPQPGAQGENQTGRRGRPDPNKVSDYV